MSNKLAVLLTCHNRKEKTIACLSSLYQAVLSQEYALEVFLVDDGSTDGTGDAIKEQFPEVTVIQGSGSLFWAGGMRLAYNSVANPNEYDLFLLLNDDTLLFKNSLADLIAAHQYSLNNHKKYGIYVGSTLDPETNKFTYGGRSLINKKSKQVIPTSNFQLANLANANILMISKNVIESIGFFDENFTHGIADYDYTLTANKKGFPIIVCPGYQGSCINDHGKNWLSKDTTFSSRIKYLHSPTGLAYNEYTYYIKKHFGYYAYFTAITKLWLKTFFPIIWDKFKKI